MYHSTSVLIADIGVNVDPVIWSVLEVYSAMICSSLVTVRPLITKYYPGFFNSRHPSQNSTNFTSSWRTRVSKPWSGNSGIELPSQENFIQHSGPGDPKNQVQVWVENSVSVEEEARLDTTDTRQHPW